MRTPAGHSCRPRASSASANAVTAMRSASSTDNPAAAIAPVDCDTSRTTSVARVAPAGPPGRDRSVDRRSGRCAKRRRLRSRRRGQAPPRPPRRVWRTVRPTAAPCTVRARAPSAVGPRRPSRIGGGASAGSVSPQRGPIRPLDPRRGVPFRILRQHRAAVVRADGAGAGSIGAPRRAASPPPCAPSVLRAASTIRLMASSGVSGRSHRWLLSSR